MRTETTATRRGKLTALELSLKQKHEIVTAARRCSRKCRRQVTPQEILDLLMSEDFIFNAELAIPSTPPDGGGQIEPIHSAAL